MKVYTRRGDQGKTDLYKAGRVSKTDPRVEACGWLDTLSAELGMARALLRDREATKRLLVNLQKDLVEIGAFVSSGGQTAFPLQRVREMEDVIDGIDATLPPLQAFVLPGTGVLEAQLHRARTVCRTAEIRVVAANESLGNNAIAPAITYLNRLSDLLFVLARKEAG